MSNEFEQVAAMLREAYDGQVLPPLRDWLEPTDAAGAYAVQAINTRYWQAQGRRIVGRKAGLTAEAVQKQLGVDQPDPEPGLTQPVEQVDAAKARADDQRIVIRIRCAHCAWLSLAASSAALL